MLPLQLFPVLLTQQLFAVLASQSFVVPSQLFVVLPVVVSVAQTAWLSMSATYTVPLKDAHATGGLNCVEVASPSMGPDAWEGLLQVSGPTQGQTSRAAFESHRFLRRLAAFSPRNG